MESTLEDLLLDDGGIPAWELKLQSKPCQSLVKLAKTTGMSRDDFRNHIERIGGPKALRLSDDESEMLERMTFGDLEIELGQEPWPLEFFPNAGALSDFVIHCIRTSHRKQPMLALLAAICMVANLIGR